jgi:cobalt-zinc-cadmium efflux system protein
MAHSHAHTHGSNISTAFYLNAVFVVIELIGGLWTNSIAILSDAVHDFGDCLSLAVAWVLQRKSEQGRDQNYSYGYRRFSLLGSLFLSGVLTVSSIWVIVEAVGRIASPQAVEAQGMLWLAVVGIVVNGAAALRVKRGTSLNEHAVFLHIMEDVLGWIAVLIVSVVMLFVECPLLDPLLSICISVWVLSHVCENLRSAFKVMLQAVPETLPLQALSEQLTALEGVSALHDLHIWSLDGERHIVSVHIVTTLREEELQQLKHAVREVCQRHHVAHVTIELERPDEQCDGRCD